MSWRDTGIFQQGNFQVGHTLRTYRVKDSTLSVAEIFDTVNAAVFDGHGPDYRKRNGAKGVVVDPLFQYERLLRGLTVLPALRCVPFRELVAELCPSDRIPCGIRHDVDVDIRAALSQAELEWKYGVRTTYFILHTAPYYGCFRDGIFLRNHSMAHVYRRLQELGHEIALHTDPLFIYQNFQIDGAEALVCELQWLRQEGLNVVGTTAHNSAAAYGAENYQIFKGRAKPIPLDTENPQEFPKPKQMTKEVVHHGKWAPLQVLDEKDLGLLYEANEVFWKEPKSFEYGAIRGANSWRWNRHFIGWKEAHDSMEVWSYDQDRLLRDIGGLEPGKFLILVIHPVYYGARHNADTGPALTIDRRSTVVNKVLGWETYQPLTMYARSGMHNGKQEFQSMTMTNEFGMLDVPKESSPEEGELRIIMFGGTNLDGSSLSLPAHMPVILAELLTARYQRPVRIWKFAYPEMGLSRHYGWYVKVKDHIRPHYVILGVGADAAMTNLPEYWSYASGFNPSRPPGQYLHWNGDEIKLIERAPDALIRRGRTRQTPDPATFAHPESRWGGMVPRASAEEYIHACVNHFLGEIRRDGARPFLMLEECGEHVGIWSEQSVLEDRRNGHAEFANWAQKISRETNTVVIDPYAWFLEQPLDLPTHWLSCAEWNYTGHRVSAQAAFAVLGQLDRVDNVSRVNQ